MTAGVLPPDDPYGDRAHMAAERERKRQRGRQVLQAPDEWTPVAGVPPPEGAAGGDAGSGGGPAGDPDDKPRIYRVLKIPRIDGDGLLIYVPVDLETGVKDPCPVVPLGVQGGVFWFLDPHGQLIPLPSAQFGQKTLQGLFSPQADWLNRAFPQIGNNKGWKGFQAQFASEALMTAASRKGVFDAREKVRGLGCWRGEDGELIQHLGNVVLVGGKEKRPGEIGAHVYPGRPAVPAPMKAGREAAEAVFEDFRSWRFLRGDLDARLLLGWIGCAVLGAALDWRPMIFLTGDAGTGKSTLQERLKKMLPGRLASTVDATPAALRQIINQDAMAVSFDEIEADMLSDQAQMVMKLARVAASGGTVFRGGKDHQSAEFQLRGCFAFSAIVAPSMRQQDMQRLTFLRLAALPKDQKLVTFTDAAMREIGCKLVGRMTDGWGRWRDTLSAYEEGLMRVGHNQRGAKQFGTLLAAADLMLFDDAPIADVVDELVRGLERENLYEYEQSEPTWLKAWRHILSAQPEVWRQQHFPTVGEVLREYFEPERAKEGQRKTNERLSRVGLSVVRSRAKANRAGHAWLAISPDHPQVAAMFANSDLRKHGGEGAWTGALRGAPKWDPKVQDGVWYVEKVPALGRARCTLYRLDASLDLQGVKTPIFDREIVEQEFDDGGDEGPGVEGAA